MRRETSLGINGISKNPYLFNSTKVTILIPYSKLKRKPKKDIFEDDLCVGMWHFEIMIFSEKA